jgi:hypothetical protein
MVTLFLILNLIDLFQTFVILSANAEANPLIAFIYSIFGYLGVIICKVIICAIVILMFYTSENGTIILVLLNIFYLVVVIHNFRALFQ